MSGWTVIALEADDEIDGNYEDDFYGTFDLLEDVREYVGDKDVYAKTTEYERSVILQLFGYIDWADSKKYLDDLDNWSRAVILRANDTSDTGEARYYRRMEDFEHGSNRKKYKQFDSFEETQLEHGSPVGSLAAAYMKFKYGISIVHDLNRPRVTRTEIHNGDDYDKGENRPDARDKLALSLVRTENAHLPAPSILEPLDEARNLLLEDLEDGDKFDCFGNERDYDDPFDTDGSGEEVDGIKRFKLYRKEDESGVSGTGVVAWGCEFPNGRCSLTWKGDTSSANWYDSVDDLLEIHGHGGKTEVRWIDE